MTPLHPFDVDQVDDFRGQSAMQLLVDDRIAILDVLDDFLVGFPTEIAHLGLMLLMNLLRSIFG